MQDDCIRGETIVGGNRLRQLLRSGGGRSVYVAHRLSDGSLAIVKLVALAAEAEVARLAREFAGLREVAGPGIVTALEYGVLLQKQVAYLALQAHGPSLADMLAAAPGYKLDTELALTATYAAALALGQLHERGWCHCDVKPGNILLAADGTAVLTDLEFATPERARGAADAAVPFPGTPPFIAPELWEQGAAALHPAADIWALGVTLFLALAGEYPFGSDDAAAIARAAAQPERVLDRPWPQPIRALLAKLFAKDPARRPANGTEAAAQVAAALAELGFPLGQALADLGAAVGRVPPFEGVTEPRTREITPTVSAPEIPTPRMPAPAPLLPGSVGAARPSAAPTPGGPPGFAPDDDEETCDFLDVRSTAEIAPQRAAPTAAPTAAPSETAAALRRRAAARWFNRMNPHDHFALAVVFTGKAIRLQEVKGMKITVGQQEIVLAAEEPFLEVEPCFPGCVIAPPRAIVEVAAETTVARFWITPLATGDLPEACVFIRYRNRLVETLPTPSKVVTRTLAKICAVFGFLSPIGSKIIESLGWNPTAELRQALPVFGAVLAALGPMRFSLVLGAALLLAALLFYWLARPLQTSSEPALFAAAAR